MKRIKIFIALVTFAVCLFSLKAVTVQAALFSFELYDSHAHLISPDTDKYPLAVRQAPRTGEQGTVIDNGRNSGNNREPGDRSIQSGGSSSDRAQPEINALLSWMAELGVEAGAAVQKRGTYGYDNSYILDSTEQHKDKLVPVVVLDAEDVNADDLVEYWAKERNLAGVRFSGTIGEDGTLPWLSSEQALKTWAMADKYGLVVDLMATPPGGPEFNAEILKLAEAYPNAKIALDHVAWPKAEGAPDYGLDSTFQAFAKYKNIYYKFTDLNLNSLSAGKISSSDMLRHVVDVYGADHVMWGSNVGQSPGSYKMLIEKMVEATSKLTDSEKRAVMHDTGKSVFIGGGTR